MENETLESNIHPGYKDIFRQKEYMKLICANVINRFGDAIDTVAFTWLVYSMTNSAAWSAVIFGINKVPTIFLQPFAGAIVENKNKKSIMVLTDIIRGLCVSLVVLMYLMKRLNPWWLLGITIVISSAEAFRNPAGASILPEILDKDYYDYGISLNSSLCSMIDLAGYACVGVIIGLFGTHTAILIDAVTFFLSALIISAVHTAKKKEIGKGSYKEYFYLLKSGLIYIKKNRITLNFVLLAMMANAILIPLNCLEAPLVKNILKQGGYLLSDLSFSISAGLCLGSVVYPFMIKRMKPRMIIFVTGISLSLYYFILILCGYLVGHVFWIFTICTISSAITGALLALLMAVLQVQFMKQIDADYLARASAIVNAGSVVTLPVASFAVSLLTRLISISSIFYVVGLTGLILFVVIYGKKVQFE